VKNLINLPFKNRLTLRFKLLVGVTILELALMASSFTIGLKLLTHETRSFTFEVQSNQAQLLGQQFASLVKVALNSSRTLDESGYKNKSILDRQSEILSFNAFRKVGDSFVPFYSWGKVTSPPPKIDQKLRSEWRAVGVAYRAKLVDRNVEIHMFYPVSGTVVVRAHLNLEELIHQTSGTHSQITDTFGQLMFDARSMDQVGQYLNLNDPLLKQASESIVAVGTQEYRALESGEKYLGTYAIPGYKVFALSAVRWVDAMRGAYLLLEKILLAGLALLGVSLIVVVYFSTKLTRPLTLLTEATHVVASGKFDLKLDEGADDEIGLLSRSMNQMSKKVQELLIEKMESVRVEQEVAIASALQRNLIPPAHISSPRFQLDSHYQAAQSCGGDWWGYIETEDSLVVLISDATGHGLPPAMLTASVHGCFSAIQKLLKQFPDLRLDPARLLTIANRMVIESSQGEINMTMLIASYEFSNGQLTLASAGHNPPLIARKGVEKIEQVRVRGQRLGESVDFPEPQVVQVPFSENDILFMFTDGLIENKDANGTEFGKEQLKTIISKNGPLGAKSLFDDLSVTLKNFYQNAEVADDLSYVMVHSVKTKSASITTEARA
jgi:serine phosphatase RsbU (regulator of sigma subunit)